MEEAKSVLDGLCSRLAAGVNMPDVAQRLLNAYDIDENLADVLLDAHTVATKSVALAVERRRADQRHSAANMRDDDAWARDVHWPSGRVG